MTRREALRRIAKAVGMEVQPMLERAMMDGEAPALCLACEAVHESGHEPDARRNHCDSCGESKVMSCLVIAQLI